MTEKEFAKKIENGRDIMFDVQGKHFTILTWTDNGIAIGEQGATTEPMFFNNPEELIAAFRVDGAPLAHLCDKIVITDYS